MLKYWFYFVVISSITNVFMNCSSYNRTIIQEKYPGFGTEWIVMGEENGQEIIGYLKKPPADARIPALLPEPKDVITFTLFTRDNRNGIMINSTDVLSKYYNKKKPTKFVTHGWLSSGTSDVCTSIRDGFLHKYDANVIVMDWNGISKNIFYPIPMQATPKVGEFYGEFLKNLIDYGSDPKQIHLVGHSLGAHISGFAARTMKDHQIGRITGLDPAQPGFSIGLVDGGHLNQSDAEFVDIIHTCAGYLGMKQSIGHVDFYPNGGNPPQPGCEDLAQMLEACSHGRSWRYFAESLIESKQFIAYQCESFKNFRMGKCSPNGIPMGDPVPVTTRGNYYLFTIGRKPYILNPDSYVSKDLMVQ